MKFSYSEPEPLHKVLPHLWEDETAAAALKRLADTTPAASEQPPFWDAQEALKDVAVLGYN